MTENNIFCWTQWQGQDVEKAKTFYQKMFSWKLTESGQADHHYTEIDAGNGPCGGFVAAPCPPHWLPFIYVENLEESCKKAMESGGQVIIPATAIQPSGSYAVFLDPCGAPLGIYQK